MVLRTSFQNSPERFLCFSVGILSSVIERLTFYNLDFKRNAVQYSKQKKMAGSPMITADLREKPSFFNIGRRRVPRHMKEMGLKCKTVKKFVVTTDSKHSEPIAPNLLDRQFSVSSPDIVYVTDITYLKVGGKWHYLTVFLDLFSRLVVGWDLSDSLERHSVMRALNKAITRRRPCPGLMIHSDRGVQYASNDFGSVPQKHGFIQSMSRKGNCWDTRLLSRIFFSVQSNSIDSSL